MSLLSREFPAEGVRSANMAATTCARMFSSAPRPLSTETSADSFPILRTSASSRTMATRAWWWSDAVDIVVAVHLMMMMMMMMMMTRRMARSDAMPTRTNIAVMFAYTVVIIANRFLWLMQCW